MQHKTSGDGMTQYVVVDGQQRITAILEFIGTIEDEGFELKFLDNTSPWRNRSFNDLTEIERTASSVSAWPSENCMEPPMKTSKISFGA